MNAISPEEFDGRRVSPADCHKTETIGYILAMSALLSIGMTLILFPLLHRVISDRYFLTFCEQPLPC